MATVVPAFQFPESQRPAQLCLVNRACVENPKQHSQKPCGSISRHCSSLQEVRRSPVTGLGSVARGLFAYDTSNSGLHDTRCSRR